MKNKKIIALFLSITLICSLAGCSSDRGVVLIVGTYAQFPPFEYIAENGSSDGFDIALVKEIGKRIGMGVEIINMEFNDLINAVGTEKIDCIASGITVNQERMEKVDFSDLYYEAVQSILVPKGNKISSVADLEGKNVTALEGSTGDFIASYDIEGTTVKRVKSSRDTVTEIKSGRADAIIIDANSAKVLANQYKDDLDLITRKLFEKENYAFAVKKGNTKLIKKINRALVDIKADGTYDKLIEKYF